VKAGATQKGAALKSNIKTMKTQVVITQMKEGETKKILFENEHQAMQYFREWCDEHGYDYDNESTEAGGIGHDYRIEVVNS